MYGRGGDKLDIALFGVGQHTENFINIIRYFGGRVICLADNDENKVGSVACGIEVISPQTLAGMDCRVIVSCIHWREIGIQLSEMGMGNRLISLSAFLKWSGDGRGWNGKHYMICMDLYSRAKWGGAENWNIMITNELAERTDRIAITCASTLEMTQNQMLGKKVKIQCFRSGNVFGEMVDYYQELLPFVFVNSFYGGNFFAVLAVKKMYPDKVRIIDVIHNDRENHYELAIMFDDWIDQYLCVSGRIKENLINVYGVVEEKVEFFNQPINLTADYGRKYNDKRPLQLGIASRLVREQKRCDLIPVLIQYLESMSIDYVMNIAGDGELSEKICEYVHDNNLFNKVHILGCLDKKKMNDFWTGQDIYINISEYEGTSLSMLEAMERGCVPLVTDVSGVRDYICDAYNGFIFDIGNLYHMAEKIKFLDSNRALLNKMGAAARQEVLSKCSVSDYANKLLGIVEGML